MAAEDETIDIEPPHSPTSSPEPKPQEPAPSAPRGVEGMLPANGHWFAPANQERCTPLEWHDCQRRDSWDDYDCDESELSDLAARTQCLGAAIWF
jgi:hypothetical protein